MPEAATPAWPVKTREMHNSHMNSTAWNDFKFREGDVVIVNLCQIRNDLAAANRYPADFRRCRRRSDMHQLSPWVDNSHYAAGSLRKDLNLKPTGVA